MISQWQETDLIDLVNHWGDAYQITVSEVPAGMWSASPRSDMTVVLTDGTADGLRQQIRADYARRTEVQREPRPHDAGGKCWCGESHGAQE